MKVHPDHIKQASAYLINEEVVNIDCAFTNGLTREEWGWLHHLAYERDEAEYQAIDAEEVDLCQPR